MLILLYLVCLCSNFLFIKSEDTANMTIDIRLGQNCIVSSAYTFTDGQTVNLLITAEKHINKGWWTLISSAGVRKMSSNLKTTNNEPIIHTSSVDMSMKGTWAFKFYYLQNNTNYKSDLPRKHYKDSDYLESMCQTNVTIAPMPTAAPVPKSQSTPYEKLLIIACSAGAVLVAIIIAQTAYIIFLKAKARKLLSFNTHNNLSKKSESVSNDTARYCSNPGQKMMKAPDLVEDDNRDSVIYEAPNIEISGNARMPMQPPQVPAITTMPRTPRTDNHMKIGPQAMLASVMNPSRSPMSDNIPPNFQRPKLDREVSVANRPPLPLPTQGHPYPDPHSGYPHRGHAHNDMFHEVYEVRLPMPPKKIPTGNLLDVKEITLKMRQGTKPNVTPKPQLARPNAQTNELEEALRRRNNVMQVPIVSIPDPSSRGSPNPKPPPAPKSKPRGPPVTQPVQEEIYYNENQASSDEEWTYEPLKPLNSYDLNIYNV